VGHGSGQAQARAGDGPGVQAARAGDGSGGERLRQQQTPGERGADGSWSGSGLAQAQGAARPERGRAEAGEARGRRGSEQAERARGRAGGACKARARRARGCGALACGSRGSRRSGRLQAWSGPGRAREEAERVGAKARVSARGGDAVLVVHVGAQALEQARHRQTRVSRQQHAGRARARQVRDPGGSE
jgi:hypothetical protein